MTQEISRTDERPTQVAGANEASTGIELRVPSDDLGGMVDRRHPQFWRSLSELADTDEFRQWLHREFPREASVWDGGGVDRRKFLQLMAASLTLAGFASGCSNQGEEKIVPYVHAPENMVLGRPLYFATTMPRGAGSLGLVAQSREGRPIKVEGNPDHPASLGATDTFAQASILTLYDPDRSATVMHLGEISTWEAMLTDLRSLLKGFAGNGGSGLRVLSEPVVSPTLARQMDELLKAYPQARWHQYEPISRDNQRQGMQLAFGAEGAPIYDFSAAAVVVALDSNFLDDGPGAVRYARDFAARRKVEPATMNRLYSVEGTFTTTGATADHRLAVKPTEVGAFTVALARKLGVAAAEQLAANANGDDKWQSEPERRRWVEAIAADLEDKRGQGVVVVGAQQPGWVHALAQAINDRLGNIGKTVRFIRPIEAAPVNGYESVAELVAAMNAGEVELLVILEGNPAYQTPREMNFAEALQRFASSRNRRAIRYGLYYDETSVLCHWHVPATHFLESWSDARSFDGTASIIQPLIAPLYEGRTIHEMMSALTDTAVKAPLEIVRATWQQALGDEFAGRWSRLLHDGVIKETAFEPLSLTLNINQAELSSAVEAARTSNAGKGNLEISILPDPTLYDGCYANNAWLQELPKPITKLTWDNAVLLAPATAKRLGLAVEDVVSLVYNGYAVEGPVWIVPGHPLDAVTVYLGHGRRQGGQVFADVGFDAYPLLPSSGQRIGVGASLERLGGKIPLACTQHHHLLEGLDVLEGREILRTGTLAAYQRDPDSVVHSEHGHESEHSLYPAYPYEGLQWGMVVDLTACTGCSACVIACQAENNIPVVGKEGVMNGREMHWLRIDMYYESDPEAPKAVHQPMLCQHCEKAPCEVVCPVMATSHSAEGLNEMTYNRCVGTRYCSNNCPYKVRRFNFFEYHQPQEPVEAMKYNPEVTVRSRGVMEKCTYCVQRINHARISAKIAQVESGAETLQIEDGTLQTACQQVCPTKAITFGNINDRASAVAKLKNDPRNYGVLAGLGTQPRTTYLARIRNTHTDLA
jgi:molybdopterin-containing oxidoreductase family iron-sulfur binding subunit